MNKILITGGEGFIGKCIKEHYKKLDYNVITCGRSKLNLENYYMCDLSNKNDVQEMIDTLEPDVIFHFAGLANPKLQTESPHQFILSNIIATNNIARCCPKTVDIVNASSVVVYGDGSIDKEHTENSNLSPTSLYGSTKMAGEMLLHQYKDNVYTLRLCATIGPTGLTHGVVKHFIHKLKYEDVFTAIGECPGTIKPYLHIDDLLNALDILVGNAEYGIYNVVPDDSISILDVSSAVMNAIKIKKSIKWLGWDNNNQGDNMIINSSNAKLKVLGWLPQYKSYEAIYQSVKNGAV